MSKRGVAKVMFGHNEIVGQKYFKEAHDDQLFVTSMFMTLQGEGPYRGEPAFFIRLAKCNLACSFCFAGDTKISMYKNKSKKIKDIVVNDMVVAWDEKNQQFVPGKVTHTFKREVDEIIRIKTGSGTGQNDQMFVTKEHPILVKNKGWVNAGDIKVGDVILHYSVSDRMHLSNPRFNEDVNKILIDNQQSPERRQQASIQMKNTWENNPKLREVVEYRAKHNNPMKDPAVAAKGFLSRKDKGKKSTIEKKFERIVHGLPINFVGDGSLVVNHKFPDYVVEGQKKLIEVWAEDADFAKNRDETWMKARSEIFAKEGYETLFVPMTTGKMDDAAVRNKVSDFIRNGYTVESVDIIKKGNSKSWVALAGGKDKDLSVYNFEVENYHTYVANNKIVHNCDTFFDDGDWLTFNEIEKRIELTIDNFYVNQQLERPAWTTHTDTVKKKMVLVITGGEPTLQKNLGPFLAKMSNIFQNTQIESNGIIHQSSIPTSTTVVISPKCLEEKGVAVRYIKPNLDNLKVAACLKFVMSADPTSPYANIPDWAHTWARETGRPIFISPMNIYNSEPKKSKEIRNDGRNRIELEERSTVDEVIEFWEEGLLDMKANELNHKYAAKFCVKNGYILNLQIHLYAGLA
jgi:7-carboxy-7-deazaguanine synthase